MLSTTILYFVKSRPTMPFHIKNRSALQNIFQDCMHVSTNVRKRKRMWLRILGAKSKQTRENFSVSRRVDVRRLWLRRVRQQFHALDHRGRPRAGDFNYFMLISSDNRVSLIPKDLFCLTSLLSFFLTQWDDCLAMITQILHAIFTIGEISMCALALIFREMILDLFFGKRYHTVSIKLYFIC